MSAITYQSGKEPHAREYRMIFKNVDREAGSSDRHLHQGRRLRDAEKGDEDGAKDITEG
ncbi:MAG: hypothetical protein R3F11_03830 [Verrucomicrobiales bacterium]